MADNKRRGRFGKESEDSSQSIFDLFEPPPDQEVSSFGRIPIIRDAEDEEEEESLDLTNVELVEAQAAAEAEAAGLQHWTEPATGQVPASLAAEGDERATEVRGPSWRGEDPNWAGPDLADVFADTEAISHERVEGRERDTPIVETTAPAPTRREPETSSLFDLGDPPETVRPAPVPAPQSQQAPAPAPAPTRAEHPPPSRPAAAPRRALDLSEPRPDAARPSDAGRTGVPAPTGRLGSAVRPAAEPAAPSRGAHDAVPRRAPAPEVTPPQSRENRASVPPPDRTVTAPRPEPRERPIVEREPGVERIAALSQDEPPSIDDLDFDDDYERTGLEEPERSGRSLGQSFVVGIALAAVVFAALAAGPLIAMGLIGLLTLVAVMELFNAMRIAGLRPATLLGLVGAVAVPAATYVRGEAGYPLVVGLAVVFGMLWYLTGADTERPVLNLGLTLTGVLWVGGLAGFAALMLREDGGVGLLLATIVITAVSDTLAYLGGRAYGTKPFHEASPNKTWEGTMTGFFGALFTGLVIGVTDLIPTFENNFTAIMVLAVVVGILAPIGDLSESLIKRDLGIKDMGTLLPGHGGVLDRVDGLLFALPGAYYVAVVYTLI